MCVLFEIASKSFDFFWVCRVQKGKESSMPVHLQRYFRFLFKMFSGIVSSGQEFLWRQHETTIPWQLMTCMPPNASLYLTFSGVRVRFVLFCCGQICPKTPIIHQKLGFWPSFKKPKPMLDGNKLANLLGPYIMTHFVQNQFLKVGRSHCCFRTTAWFLVPCSSHDIVNGKSATPRRF